MSEAFRTGFDPTEPFYRTVSETVGWAIAGAALFAAVVWVYDRKFRAKGHSGMAQRHARGQLPERRGGEDAAISDVLERRGL
jgi:hypothetical protein